jgi:hypothetical protein
LFVQGNIAQLVEVGENAEFGEFGDSGEKGEADVLVLAFELSENWLQDSANFGI